jgi:hypothetical protein
MLAPNAIEIICFPEVRKMRGTDASYCPRKILPSLSQRKVINRFMMSQSIPQAQEFITDPRRVSTFHIRVLWENEAQIVSPGKRDVVSLREQGHPETGG